MMRAFFSAGEASGDAYGAEILAALLRKGAFADRELVRDLVAYAGRLEGSQLRRDWRAAADWTADIYAGGREGNFHERLAAKGPSGFLDPESLIDEVTADVSAGRMDKRRLMAESVFAVGGTKLREAGAAIVADSSHWGAVGIAEALRVVPKAIAGYDESKRRLTKHDPGLFVPIDYGFSNVKLSRIAKAAAWKVLYFAPPGSWRRDKQGADLPAVTDAIVTPFPWSAEILNRMGADARFFGHPLKALIGEVPDVSARSGIALLPGSRRHEVKHNLPVMAAVANAVKGKVRVCVAPNLEVDDLERAWESLGGPPAEFTRDGRLALKESRGAVVCSGTATLEAALCRCPSVIVYKVSRILEWEFRVRRPQFDFIGLPNILLERRAVPELIQYDANSRRILEELAPLLEDGTKRRDQLEAFDEIDAVCGPSDCFEKTADLAIELARDRH